MAEKIIKQMDSVDIKISKRKVGAGYNDQQHIEALKDFDLKLFSKEELIMMEEVADKWNLFSGAEMKSASHGEAPWIATKPDGIIDYNLTYYRNKYGEMDKDE
jgi:uncharacterized phage-associated protein